MITIPPGVLAALHSDRKPAHLVTVQIGDNEFYFTEASTPITFEGNEYLANGIILGMGAPKYTAEARVNESSVTFSGADQTMVALLLNNNGGMNKRLIVRRVWLDANGSPIDNYAMLLNNYRITGYSGDEKWRGESRITVKVASELVRWKTPRGRRTTPASQQRFYAGDKGFEFAASVQKEQKWGSE